MTKTSIGLQDLRRRIYLKAKADQEWRFWGLYVHVCKPETLREAYEMARRNGGAAGIDGVTFADIEEAGLEAFLDGIHDELVSRSYRPSGNRQVEIRFQLPPRQTQHADFRHWAFLLPSSQGLCGRSCRGVWLFFVDDPGSFGERHGKSYLTRRRRGGAGGGGGSLTGGAVLSAYRWA